jgi:ABC-type iron transport system FetAB ATPase subunit
VGQINADLKEHWYSLARQKIDQQWVRVFKVRLDRGNAKCEFGRVVRQGCCSSLILFNLYSEYLIKEAVEGVGGFKISAQLIRTVKYAGDLVLLAEEETVLQRMRYKLFEV